MTAVDLIAQTLGAHPGVTDEDPAPELLCQCGATFGYLISDEFYEATRLSGDFDEAVERAAFAKVEAELAAHQAQAVTEALGLVEEWGVRHSQGLRQERNERDARETFERFVASDHRIRPEARGKNRLVTRGVTDWKETD